MHYFAVHLPRGATVGEAIDMRLIELARAARADDAQVAVTDVLPAGVTIPPRTPSHLKVMSGKFGLFQIS